MAKKAYSSSYKSKDTSQFLVANSGHHVTTAHKEKLYPLIGSYMKFSLMKGKMRRTDYALQKSQRKVDKMHNIGPVCPREVHTGNFRTK